MGMDIANLWQGAGLVVEVVGGYRLAQATEVLVKDTVEHAAKADPATRTHFAIAPATALASKRHAKTGWIIFALGVFLQLVGLGWATFR